MKPQMRLLITLVVLLLSSCRTSMAPTQDNALVSTQVSNLPPTPSIEANLPNWVKSIQPLPGWEFVDFSSDKEKAFFVHEKTQNTQFGRKVAFVRIETKNADLGPLSTKATIEFECKNARSRVVQIIEYKEHNLEGISLILPIMTDWSYNAPDSIGAAIFKKACQATISDFFEDSIL